MASTEEEQQLSSVNPLALRNNQLVLSRLCAPSVVPVHEGPRTASNGRIWTGSGMMKPDKRKTCVVRAQLACLCP